MDCRTASIGHRRTHFSLIAEGFRFVTGARFKLLRPSECWPKVLLMRNLLNKVMARTADRRGCITISGFPAGRPLDGTKLFNVSIAIAGHFVVQSIL